ncbi:ribbon-helix-helix protein, CopG family [Agrobacterium tumefaciens]|nr:ribbon-helix-helix protein, CopG family [Agrobacterium sp. rho-8.1]NTE01542.1 ribbon-helix-helix protein, CopG family [Agrobacterium tumefaciens]NTE11802.1 ribbon-helix-helix protein, CopG family [Agrobacterium tumefaciens]NTE31984.1 ribbon-helix-helix protein, CopG family [Agrobacterium tumefaciens]
MKRETTENRRTEEVRKNVAAHRARQAAAGRVALNTYVPGELIEAIDQIKEQRGASSRMPIIEEALRFYIENAPRA